MQVQNEIYNLLLKRLHEAGVMEQLRMGNASIIDPAEVPTVPTNPKKIQKALVGLLVGLGVGLGVAFGLNMLDTSVRTPDDIERGVGIPFLGAINQFPMPKEATAMGELILLARPHSGAAEAFRNVRTSLILARPELPQKALLITSVGPREGKTVIAANLAVALAQAGRKVLLVDADMRRPRLDKLFGVSGEGPGLVEVLGEGAPLDAAARPTDIERLSVLPCPTAARNPSELLELEGLATLIANAKAQYDYVLFDSPPLMAVTDPMVLAPRMDGVVLVIKGGGPPRELLLRAAMLLADANATLVGGVLNLVDPRAATYYGYGYKYYYAYRYYREHYGRYYDRGENA
jgi:capsular exopolysaccharide synthesis family protein